MIEPMAPRRPDTPDTTFSQYLASSGRASFFELRIDDAPAARQGLRAPRHAAVDGLPAFLLREAAFYRGIVVQMCGSRLINIISRTIVNWNPTGSRATPRPCAGWPMWPATSATSTLRCILHPGADGSIVEDGQVTLPQPGRRTIVCLGDTNVALFKADDPSVGPVGDYFSTPRSGIHSLVWEVDDLGVAEAICARSASKPNQPNSMPAGSPFRHRRCSAPPRIHASARKPERQPHARGVADRLGRPRVSPCEAFRCRSGAARGSCPHRHRGRQLRRCPDRQGNYQSKPGRALYTRERMRRIVDRPARTHGTSRPASGCACALQAGPLPSSFACRGMPCSGCPTG